jgi:hypothetical protein
LEDTPPELHEEMPEDWILEAAAEVEEAQEVPRAKAMVIEKKVQGLTDLREEDVMKTGLIVKTLLGTIMLSKKKLLSMR